MTVHPVRLAATFTTLACASFGLAVLTGSAAQAATVHHSANQSLIKAAAGDSCDPGDGDTGTMDDVGDCIDN